MHATRNVYQTCTTKAVEYFLSLTKAIQGAYSRSFIEILQHHIMSGMHREMALKCKNNIKMQ